MKPFLLVVSSLGLLGCRAILDIPDSTLAEADGGSIATTSGTSSGGHGGTGGMGGSTSQGGAGGALQAGEGDWAFASSDKGNGRAAGRDLALAGADLFVAGTYRNDITASDDGTLLAGGLLGGGIFLTNLKLDGEAPRAYGFEMDGAAHAVAADEAGHLFIGGSFLGSMTIGDLIDTDSATFRKAFIAMIDPGTGAGKWARVFTQAGTPDSHSTVLRAAISKDGAGCPDSAKPSVVVLVASDGTIDFGDGPRGAVDAPLVGVAKLDMDGNLCWAHHFAAGYAEAPPVAAALGFDADDNQFAGFHASLALDAEDAILVAGAMGRGINDTVLQMSYCDAPQFCGAGVSTAPHVSKGGADVFVLKLAPDGQTQWGRTFGGMGGNGDGDQWADAIAVVGSESASTEVVYVTGTLVGSLELTGPQVLTAANGDPGDAFLLRLDGKNGNPIWGVRMGDAGLQRALAVTWNPSIWPIVALVTDGAPGSLGVRAFGDDGQLDDAHCSPLVGAAPAAATADIVVMAFNDNSHDCRWGRRFGDPEAQVVYGIATDPGGYVYLTGSFAGALDFGGGASISTSTENPQMFAARLKP
jgi:hypothetical protein